MTTPAGQLPPANWYPDPQNPGQLRYWDGQRWTQHTHPGQGQAQANPAAAQAPAAGPATAGTIQPSGAAGGPAAAGGAFQPSGMAGGPAAAGGAFQPSGTQQPAAGPASGAVPVAGGAAAGSARQAFQPSGSTSFAEASPTAAGTDGTIRPSVRNDAFGSPDGTGPPKKEFDEDKFVKEPIGAEPSSAAHWIIPAGRSKEARLAGFSGFLALLLMAVAVFEYLPPFDAYMTAGVSVLAMTLGLAGIGKAKQGFHGGGRSWFGVITGFIAFAVATFVYLYPEALRDIVLTL